jgi:hypothetical protein
MNEIGTTFTSGGTVLLLSMRSDVEKTAQKVFEGYRVERLRKQLQLSSGPSLSNDPIDIVVCLDRVKEQSHVC